ncbi:hypothetical protein [Vibrio mediterranei]|uniref:hypothetical protein n=1 Tax=Vibrio mediterranei TaxID=689 RepID=UPI001C11496B|nr:hypothetical protein [Vibrio mediterranei]
MNNIHQDALQKVRNLPSDLLKDLPILLVDRKGDTENSFMRTEDFIGYAVPNQSYKITTEGLKPALAPSNEGDQVTTEPTTPKRAILNGEWDEKIDLTIPDANILGGNGSYTLPDGDSSLDIPIAEATAENISYYGCKLVKWGDVVSFESTGNLPVTITNIGETYAEDYLLKAEHGGGTYLEKHDRPHFHMPIDKFASGFLILGKEIDSVRELSAFQIPYGYGIVMAPWTIHSDAYLVGRYMVIYSATPEFSTVILRKKNRGLATINFVNHYCAPADCVAKL